MSAIDDEITLSKNVKLFTTLDVMVLKDKGNGLTVTFSESNVNKIINEYSSNWMIMGNLNSKEFD